MTGLGLGVWSGGVPNGPEQQDRTKLFYTALIKCLNYYSEKLNTTIFYIDLSYFNTLSFENFINFQKIKPFSVKITNSENSYFSKVVYDELLVLSFAWDGISYPGNEYYNRGWSDSGDPQAAVNSSLGVLGNPDINPNMYNNHFSPTLECLEGLPIKNLVEQINGMKIGSYNSDVVNSIDINIARLKKYQ